ncbi:G-type lectin S-receptor-like serine/threonine-protein kinase At2g19130 [Aegilops tauschii subsp. strangulata]|uniref:Receptor-like serine/threonine-protein kinase n=1 Tax=Aegilops tauschii subsp. strangulata TaxID=200361 RepID=A0A453SFC7_AEGTS|nr:G-type lectin S-receptor-like serine/threonine-protein kinase At2g19130 [Aegilops tauschii subsp. strangulata]
MATLHMFLGLLLLSMHTIPPSIATKDDTLAPGQPFAVGDKLVSSNGKFALGFFQPSAGNTSKSSTSPHWYLAIWFNKIHVITPVWVANRETPIAGPDLRATQLQVSEDGNLVVLNNATQSVVWSTNITNTRTNTNISNARTNTSNTRAILLGSGNLVIESLSSEVLWQSFDDPTDVLLPGAKIGWNKVTGLNRLGISWKSRIDPGLGSFSVGLVTNGTRMVTARRRGYPSEVYWWWSPDDHSSMQIPAITKLLQMSPQTSMVVPEYVNNREEEYYMYTSPDEISSFLFMDVFGQARLNVWSQDNQAWHSIYVNPADPCTPYAACGPFTVCTGSSHPPCECMESFSRTSPQDWELGDRTGGCSRNTPLDCNGNRSSTDVFHPIARVALPYGPQSLQHAPANRSECEWACLTNCSCTAYSYHDSKCSVWQGELFSVNKDDGIEISSEYTLYIRLAAGDVPSSTRDGKRKPAAGAVIAASVISFGLLMLMLLLVILRNRFNWCGMSSQDTNQGSVGVVAFRYADLGRATKNFSVKLGAGGFGTVFKGVLSDLTSVAVKRLEGARQGEKQFRAEVSALGLIQHINLVKLVGFCCHGDKRLLVYEHMCNGSLDSHLFQSNGIVLNWSTRYQIAIGVARGLSYLHQSCRECIIHCDIKPENVLLDESFVPKIADFGLASVIGRDFSRVLTTFRGTTGYLAPEWLSGVAITSKVDVYSFGMVLIEIISGRRNASVVHTNSNDHVTFFPVQAINKLHEGDVQSLVDPELHGDFNLDEVERVCNVACWCIQDNELERPTMGEVVRVLEGLMELDMPPMPRLLAAITT